MRGGMLLSRRPLQALALVADGGCTNLGEHIMSKYDASQVQKAQMWRRSWRRCGVGPGADVASVVIVQAELLRFQNGLGAFLMIVACGSPHHPRAHISLRTAHACTGDNARMHARNAAHRVKRDNAHLWPLSSAVDEQCIVQHTTTCL